MLLLLLLLLWQLWYIRYFRKICIVCRFEPSTVIGCFAGILRWLISRAEEFHEFCLQCLECLECVADVKGTDRPELMVATAHL